MTPKIQVLPVNPDEDELLQMDLELIKKWRAEGKHWAADIIQKNADARRELLKNATRTVERIFPR